MDEAKLINKLKWGVMIAGLGSVGAFTQAIYPYAFGVWAAVAVSLMLVIHELRGESGAEAKKGKRA